MQVLVNLNFSYAESSKSTGNFLAQAIVTDMRSSTELMFELSPITEIQYFYNCWQDNYYKLILQPKGFKKGNKNIPSSIEECHKYVTLLRNQLNQWLLPIKSELEKIDFIKPNSEIYFFINNQKITSESITEILHKIPWREWDYFTDCDALEAVLHLHETEFNAPSVADSGIFRRVRITSIFGDVENIQEGVKRDKEEIEKLEKRGAELIHLEQPQRQDLKKLWDEPCDILFYSGHSNSEGNSTSGRFKINENENLSLEEIRNTFREAINKGLKIAIFNSCDGLGLACELARLGLPYIIVWRESVPVDIAQRFIEYFLCSYSRGKSLFDSVRDARIKLKELTNKKESKKQIPGLNWLPIICVSTKDEPPLWEDLGGLSGKLPDSPYQGLSAFGEEDAPYFFGRDKFVGELVEAVNTKSLVPIIGASGSGKSSVVFAGLVPRLREAHMQIVSFRPGKNPFDNLAIALKQQTPPLSKGGLGRLEELESQVNLENDEKALCRLIENLKNLTPQPPSLQGNGENSKPLSLQEINIKNLTPQPPSLQGNGENSKPLSLQERGLERGSHKRFILIIDQFEELYTLTPEAQQKAFLNALLYTAKHAPNFCLVFTLRADFYGCAISHRELSDVLQQGIYNASPMNEAELRAVIEQPTAKMKVELESGLTDKLIDELGNQTGSLPLLEFTLLQLWDKHDKWYLTHQAYKEIGGLKQALAKYADDVINPLSVAQKEKIERIFIQLISPGEGIEDTKRKATRGEIGEDNWSLVEFLANQRLVVTGWDETTQQETVEIVHEALIPEWGMLREWIQSNRRFRIWQERLQFEVVKWDKSREGKYLLSSGNLGEAESWFFDEKYRDYLSNIQRKFIRESFQKRDREEQEKLRLQKRAIRWLSGGLVAASLATGFAGWNWMQSEIRATSSNLKSLAVNSKSSLDQGFHHDAIMEAMEASQLLSNTPWKTSIPNDIQQQVKAALFNVTNDSIFFRKTLKGHQDLVNSIEFSPDGKTIASASSDKTVKIWDTATSKLIKTLKGHQGRVWSVEFSPDGKSIASASEDSTVKIWDTKTGKLIKTLEGHQDSVNSVKFNPEDKTIASASDDETVKIWDTTTGKPIQTLKRHQSLVTSIEFSPDGTKIASASEDTTVKIWDVVTGKTIQNLKGHQSSVASIEFSPDGKVIASTSDDETVKIWDITTGEPIQTLEMWVNGLEFSPDSKTIFSGSANGTVKIWDVEAGTSVNTLKFQIPGTSMKFSPDGKIIAFASVDNTVKIWDTDSAIGKPIQILKGHEDIVNSLEFSPDGKTVASASGDETVKIWDAATGKTIQTLEGHQNWVNSVKFNPQGKTIASASSDKTVKIWDIATGKVIQTLKGNQEGINRVEFSPDGKTIASLSGNGNMKIWNITTGKSIQIPEWVNSIEFSPDGKTIASASDDEKVKIWNVITGKPIQTLKENKNVNHAELSPDVNTIASATVDNLKFSPDGKTIASAYVDNTVKIWDVITGKPIQTLKGHQGEVINLEFSPNGKTIASTSADNTIKTWDTATGEEIQTLKGHQSGVISLEFSPDGKTIASASVDNTLKIWDTVTGKKIQTLKGYNSPIFSLDGKTIAFAANNDTVKILNWDFEDLLKKGCKKFREYLVDNPDKLEQLEVCQDEFRI